jgi:NADH-quinone oxidoreductase subunit N
MGATGAPGRAVVLVGALGLLTAAALLVAGAADPAAAVTAGGMVVKDRLAVLFGLLFVGSTLLVLLAATAYGRRAGQLPPEFPALLLFACAGMMVMASAAELITIYLSLELTGIALYSLAGLHRDGRGAEAGMKFLLLGAFSSAVLLYGMAILFGLTGSTDLRMVGQVLTLAGGANGAAALAATALLVAGFGFKLASVPFQMWAPDVYEGAPTPVTAFLSVASKAAGFAVVLRVFHTALGSTALVADWTLMFAALSAVSMTVGNLGALRQTNLKRMLGYSSVAQAGYLLLGLATAPQAGVNGVLFFLVSYAFTNLAAFFAIIAIAERTGGDDVDSFRGAFHRYPLLALVLALSMLSLTGIPPASGFFAKLFLFGAALQAGWTWLVVLGVVNSVVSAYYYLGVVKAAFLGTAREEAVGRPGFQGIALAMGLAAAGTLVIGVLPGPAFTAATAAAAALFRP